MSLTLPELQKIHEALMCPKWHGTVDDALEIVSREIDQMKQDQLLSESKANPT